MNRRDFIQSLLSLPALAFLPWRKPEVVTFTGTETLGRMPQAGPGMSVGIANDLITKGYFATPRALSDEEVTAVYQILTKAYRSLPGLKGFWPM